MPGPLCLKGTWLKSETKPEVCFKKIKLGFLPTVAASQALKGMY